MCYYDHYRYECGDWKWGNFKVHCEREYRMGETCGMKMVNATIPLNGVCRYCQNIETKKRRLKRAIEDYQRFRTDPQRQATAGVRYQEILDLQKEIKALEEDRTARRNQVGNGRRADHRAHG